jgi:hypothetical protein
MFAVESDPFRILQNLAETHVGAMNPTKDKIRPLTEREIEELEQTIGQSVDRDHLVYWVSEAIRDVVRLSNLPSARKYRDGLMQIAGEGRRWLRRIEEFPGASHLPKRIELDEVTSMMARFCDRVESLAEQFGTSIKRGHPRTSFGLEAFLDRMVGIAKRAKVLPSTSGRALRSQTAPRLPPAFFNFVLKALAISRDVIKTSPLPETKRKAALSTLRVQSEDALSKVIEGLRGQIGSYSESTHGLVERDTDK